MIVPLLYVADWDLYRCVPIQSLAHTFRTAEAGSTWSTTEVTWHWLFTRVCAVCWQLVSRIDIISL